MTIPRERLQDVVDDAVRRGRMTRGDAEELVNRLVTRGREQADDILGELERVVAQLRDEVSERTSQQRRTAERTAGRAKRELGDATDRARKEVGSRAEDARKRAVGAVDHPLATADRARRKARVPGFPISAYDQLVDSPDRQPPGEADARRASQGPRLRADPQGAQGRARAPWTASSAASSCRGSCGARRSPWRARPATRASSAPAPPACASSLRTSSVASSSVLRQFET